MSDFLPARRPLRGRGWGVSLPGRCSGPFRPISTPGGRCCSLTGLGPRTPVPLPCTGAALSGLRRSLLLGRSATPLHPTLKAPRPSTPLAPGRTELPDPPPRRAPPSGPRDGRPPPPPQPGHTQIHTPTSGQLPARLRLPPGLGPGAPPPSRCSALT